MERYVKSAVTCPKCGCERIMGIALGMKTRIGKCTLECGVVCWEIKDKLRK